MKDITENEMKFILTLFKNPKAEYNARSIAKLMEISHMGAMKIGKRLEKEGMVSSRLVGKARIYKLTLGEEYTIQYISFLLKREAKNAHPYVRVWIKDLKRIEHAYALILFGSVLTKHEKANDVDVLVITDNKNFEKVNEEIELINKVTTKRIHPIFQTKTDLKKNLEKRDKVLENAIKGVAVFGEKTLMEVIK
jgi:predicted nucleotidyltransferase